MSEVKVGEAEKSSEEDFLRTLKVMLLHVLAQPSSRCLVEWRQRNFLLVQGSFPK